jgi:hypothetical protein
MKREIFKETAIILLSLSLVFIFGCSENNSLNQPDNQPSSVVSKNDNGMSLSPISALQLPPALGLQKGKGKKSKGSGGWSDTEEVKADKSVKLKIKEKYESEFGKIEVEIKVEIKKNYLEEGSFITMTCDPSTGVISFLPHMIYDKIAKVSVGYKGLSEWLSGVTAQQINFVYLEANGDYIAIDQSNIKIKYKDDKVDEVSIKDVDGLNCARYIYVVTE